MIKLFVFMIYIARQTGREYLTEWRSFDRIRQFREVESDYFGRYDGNLIILSQGLTSFTSSGIEIQNVPLQTFFYWFWYQSGTGTISGEHKTSKDYQVDGVNPVRIYDDKTGTIYNLNGMKQTYLERGINIVNGKKIIVK